MGEDPRRIIARLHVQILRPGGTGYLRSQQFLEFCREHDLEDAWQEAVDYCSEKPGLSGDDVTAMAFHLLLRHVHDRRREVFPAIVAGVLAGISRHSPGTEFSGDIPDDLVRLGYSPKEADALLSGARK